MSAREATIRRTTTETDIEATLRLDGNGSGTIATGVGFLDHLLTQFTVHGLFELRVCAKGDRQVDDHHTVEDVGLTLGEAIATAIDNRAGIARYGSATIPMDESLALVAIDLSGRSGCWVTAPFTGTIGAFDAELIEEFLIGVSRGGRLTLHARIFAGTNRHHMAEALFKALGRAMAQATALDPRRAGVPSSKGSLG
jgi:imidazoleglycerol-phosphate dehydratase